MAKPLQFTPSRKEKYCALIATGVPLARAAEQVGVSIYTVINHRKSDPTFAAFEDASRDAYYRGLTVKAETGLAEAVERGDTWAIKYILNNRMANDWSDKPMVIQVNSQETFDRLQAFMDNAEQAKESKE